MAASAAAATETFAVRTCSREDDLQLDQFVRQSAVSGDHVAEASRDHISGHQYVVEKTNSELIAVVG